ncbi:MAG: glycoside hydrolase family 3 C-terminal domain-containing protein [Candidatus Hydrogenedentes bacterium]|nr:glycoside hydrolase family 3 C-terminal domain-containing protein [Candidatus Hydrogenedentota bacterium]
MGIPELIMADGPQGPNSKGRSTHYSAMINLAATFDTDLMHAVAKNMGQETRIFGRNMLLAPMINIIRTPFGGRGFELFSEDPYLTSRMTVSYVKGVQEERVVTCTKVMTVNNQEWNRFDVDTRVGERALREIYLPAYKAAVQEADTWSIMAAYNMVNGHYACESKYLLNDILKEEWGFTGFTVSDWGGVRSTVKTAHAGLDLEMPTGKFYGKKLLAAIQDGRVKESILDDKVRRILRVLFKAGLFDESIDSYGGHSDTPERRALALKAAQESIVLLKNEDHFLPLDAQKIKSIAVIGPNGNVARMTGSGSGFLKGNHNVSPLQGIVDRVGANTTVQFERGFPEKKMELPIAQAESYVLPDGQPGIHAEYFNNRELEGKPALTRVEKSIDFAWGYGGEQDPDNPGSPDPGVVNLDKWSARWTGKFKSPGDGWHEIGLQSDNGVRMYLDGKKVLDYWIDSKPEKFKTIRYKFEAGRLYDLKVEFYENIGSCVCRLGFAPSEEVSPVYAMQVASEADVVVLCLGLSEEMEGEANDRDELDLPENQLKLIDAVVQSNENTVIVLNNGTPILVNEWIDKVPAVIEAFYPGQEGGTALATILFGDISPSGRLPLTIPKERKDASDYGTYPGEKSFADYKEGIYVGYRHFDAQNIEPSFPFGYGLSYTTFDDSDLKLTATTMKSDGEIVVSLNVKNTGNMDGDEVVQLYIHDIKARVDREVKALKGFHRVHLKRGESKTVTLKIDTSALSFYDVTAKQWVAEPGQFDVLIGASSRDIHLRGGFVLE